MTFSLFLAWSHFAYSGILDYLIWHAMSFCIFPLARYLSPVFGHVLDLRRELEKLETITRLLECGNLFSHFPALRQSHDLPLTASPHRPSASLRQLARLSHGSQRESSST